MEALRISARRHWLAALAALVLALSGAGRGWAAAPDAAPRPLVIGGVRAPICHADNRRGGPGSPASGETTDCCTACGLHAPALCPTAPEVAQRVFAPGILPVAARPAERTRMLRWRSPRQAQGPPASPA